MGGHHYEINVKAVMFRWLDCKALRPLETDFSMMLSQD
jgi:hypothetical protein